MVWGALSLYSPWPHRAIWGTWAQSPLAHKAIEECTGHPAHRTTERGGRAIGISPPHAGPYRGVWATPTARERVLSPYLAVWPQPSLTGLYRSVQAISHCMASPTQSHIGPQGPYQAVWPNHPHHSRLHRPPRSQGRTGVLGPYWAVCPPPPRSQGHTGVLGPYRAVRPPTPTPLTGPRRE